MKSEKMPTQVSLSVNNSTPRGQGGWNISTINFSVSTMHAVSLRKIGPKLRIWGGGRIICQADYEKSYDEFYRVLNCNMPSKGSISSIWLKFRVFPASMSTFWSLNLSCDFARNCRFSCTSGPNVDFLGCCTSHLWLTVVSQGGCIVGANKLPLG